MKQNVCCIVGVNLSKFPVGYKEEIYVMDKLKMKLMLEIEEMRRKGVTTFLTGMGRGPELWAGEIILDLKRAYPADEIRLVAVVPYFGQADNWMDDYHRRYYDVLRGADSTITLQSSYTLRCILRGYRYMVDNSAYMIAVHGKEAGEVKYAVEYARGKGVEAKIIRTKEVIR